MRRLSPRIEDWLKRYNSKVQQLLDQGFKPTPANARHGLADITRALVTRWPEIEWVQDDLVPGDSFDVPVRIYHPASEVALPVLIYFHGGGHMAGSVDVYDPICRKMALHTQHVVVSVDYRLAPECPYPAGVEDCCQVVRQIWAMLQSHGLHFRQQLAIGGDSGGGALCATVAHRTQDDPDVAIGRQILMYPSLDYTLSSESIAQNSRGYLLEEEKINWYFDYYFQNDEDRRAASPLFMAFSRRMPETLVITAEFCPLRDEGAAYVRKARAAGVHAEQFHFPEMIHAFLNLEDLTPRTCRDAYARIGEFLNA